ncbi:hypothetical protein L484_000043 [Morus notabilis]|uniref:Transmembrane protein n=1 Tax=Morus notabilis TaxID=981085 RepID=W9SDS5_9ROSA|nr:hypothetical protein L484_004569 [Morus notabilis]EXC63147.1 hypothetical protein L484_000043 [Morus notabilis]
MCPTRWYTSAFRWPEFDFRLPELDFSYLTSGWSSESFRWFGFSIVDDVLWTLVSLVESLALAAMLCFFFVFCGCTL